ncbi:hypothetical protein C4J93_4114 [Pseudomonas sp. R2-37-08W]|nr:hypothetical protein C4J93_4114 [Pseudomonas sp. R2-37-08W]AZF17568.1 hypothetical protein C4J92_4111 [Pseudomonas sp. R3-18-08]AZF49292.1 hypothetical protein C4J86_4084 [Pseudomonas sp. R2-7-07]
MSIGNRAMAVKGTLARKATSHLTERKKPEKRRIRSAV